MINYHYQTWEVNDIWFVDIFANSDKISCRWNDSEYHSQREAIMAAEAFIDGIKFVRGEQ